MHSKQPVTLMAANAALAALVTQAPEEPQQQSQQPPQAAQSPQTQPRQEQKTAPAPAPSGGAVGWFFRCFRKPKDKSPSKQHNLVSVVPITEAAQPSPKPQESSTSQSQRQAPQEAKAQEVSSSSSAIVPAVVPPEAQKREEQKQEVARSEEKEAQVQQIAVPAKSQRAPNERGESSQGPNRIEPGQLGPQTGPNIGRKTLVLDLDETLVHSSFRQINNADIIIAVEIEGEHHQVYVRKRPGCDEFLVRVAQLYEIVIYTASMSKYASPLLDKLDKSGVCTWRLYREACTRLAAGYVKDLSRLGRDLKHVIIIDNSPVCYSLQPDNAIPIQTWRDDVRDRELLDLIPILISLAEVDDIPQVLRQIIWAADDEDEPPSPRQSNKEGG